MLLCSTLVISSCTQQVKSDKSPVETPDNQNTSISSSDREKYRDGITALNNEDLSKAQRIFSEFIRNNPTLAGAYTNLALTHYKKNEIEQAMKLVDKAIELNPEQSQAFNLRAQLYVNNGKIHDAKKDYLKAIELKPEYINAQYNLALLYDIYLQEIELAIKHYEIYMSLLKKPDEATQEWINHLKGTLAR